MINRGQPARHVGVTFTQYHDHILTWTSGDGTSSVLRPGTFCLILRSPCLNFHTPLSSTSCNTTQKAFWASGKSRCSQSNLAHFLIPVIHESPALGLQLNVEEVSRGDELQLSLPAADVHKSLCKNPYQPIFSQINGDGAYRRGIGKFNVGR